MPRSEEKNQEIRNAAKCKIMDAALKLFASKGFKGTSMSDVAQEAGVSKGLAYLYFDSKETIAKELVLESIAKSKEIITSASTIPDPCIRIQKTIKNAFKFIENNENYWRLMTSFMMQVDLKEGVIEHFIDYQIWLTKNIGKHFQELNISDFNFEARMLLALFEGIQIHYYYGPDKSFFKKAQKYLLKRFSPEGIRQINIMYGK